MKGKTLYSLLMLILVAGTAALPFGAIGRTEASSISSIWVEL